MISIIIPTITGREDSLKMVKAAYRTRTGSKVEIITPKDHPSWGAGCNAGAAKAKGDILHFGNDDLEPLHGWADAALRVLADDELPAPQVWNHTQEGDPADLYTDGPAGALTEFTRVPILTRRMADEIGPFPAIHYFCDNWVSAKARTLGYPTRVTHGYWFVHHWHPVGRLDTGDWVSRDKPLYEAALRDL